MATNTYVALDTKAVTSTVTSVTFSSIPQTYTDLIIVFTGTVGTLDNNNITFNGDTTSNYSVGRITGTNAAATSSRGSNLTSIQCGEIGTSQSTDIIQIQNYSNTTTNKMILHRSGNTSQFLKFSVGMWRPASLATGNITSITITNAGVFTVGSTFTLYGIASSDIGAPKAFGGTITQDATYTYHTFGASGTFTPQQSLTADVLVVAGGGGGGGSYAGGGGAGGLLAFTSQSLSATNYTCTVGAGGNGGAQGVAGSTGVDSQFGALTLVKGGGYGAHGVVSGNNTGGNGGSGGGGGRNAAVTPANASGGTATSGQGNNGGTYLNSTSGNVGAGGGGAGAAGSSQGIIGSGYAGAGGIGSSAYSSWGLATGTGQNVSGTIYYAGGGGGGAYSDGNFAAPGGAGGGASGGQGVSGSSALTNTGGGGGGGGGNTSYAGGNGGSGIVIIRYAN